MNAVVACPADSAATSPVDATADEQARQLAAGLYPHQVEGVGFLLGRQRAVLADDMGLGKTRQAIVALTHAAPEGPWLVVTPASVKANWGREIEAARPGAEVRVVGPAAAPGAGYRGFVIVNYDILHRHVESLLALCFTGLVFDEAHYLKNRESRRSRLGLKLVAAASPQAPVYALTGTPLTNRPRDLFPLLALIGHPLGRSFLSFAKRYCAAWHNGFGWVTDGASNLEELALEVRGALLRRTKDEVLDLPPKLRNWLPVPVKADVAGDTGRVISELLRSRARQRAGRPGTDAPQASGAGADRARLIASITRLRRKLAEAKVSSTADLVAGAVEQGEKVLVFSCFEQPVKKLGERFGEAALTLTGKTPQKRRQAIVDRFQDDDSVRVLVANIVAGGVGLNLTAARQVVFNDLDWVPANHWQAEDRAYRIGQSGSVNVHYMVGSGTLDEFVREVLLAKAALSSAVIDGEALGVDTDVLSALENAVRSLSPGLVSGEAAAVDGEALARELAETASRWRQEETSGAEGAGARREVPAALVAALARVLAGPKVRRYRVCSNSRPGLWYDLEFDGSDLLCGCPGFGYRGSCSHSRKLRPALLAGKPLPAGFAPLNETQ